MSSSQDLGPLLDRYTVVAELSGHDNVRTYVAKRREDGKDVLVTVMQAAPDVAEGKAISQFAADVNLLTGFRHPNMPQVLEGVWLGDDSFALVSQRVLGTTLAELMKGDRITNPRIAAILTEVDGVLTWARGERIAHRGVTPHDVMIERETGKVWVSLSPTEAPKTSRPEPRDDAHTVGALAKAMLLARPMADDHDGTLATMRPDLPQRVVDATERVATCTINDELPDVSAFLASLAMADAIKEGELEVARLDAEFRATMKAEREKWEAEQHACKMENEAQAKKFAEERSEYDRRAAKEREQLTTARAEIDKRRAEVQAARAELDQARSEFKAKKSELEGRVKEIDRHARDLEKRARELESQRRELERKNRELSIAAAAAMAPTAEMAVPRAEDAGQRAEEEELPVAPIAETAEIESVEPEEAIPTLGAGVESVEDVHEPWTPIEEQEPWAVPLHTEEPVSEMTYDGAAVSEPEGGRKKRPAWMIPTAALGALIVLVGAAMALERRGEEKPVLTAQSIAAGAPNAIPATPPVASPTSGTVVDSAAGNVAPTLSDSAIFNAIRDSIVEADAEKRAARKAKAADEAAAREREARTVTDSNGVKWTTVAPPPLDSVQKMMTAPRPDSAKRDTTRPPKKDTLKVKPDTAVRPDTGRTRFP